MTANTIETVLLNNSGFAGRAPTSDAGGMGAAPALSRRYIETGNAGVSVATLCLVRRRGSPDALLLGRKKRGFAVGKYGGFGGKVHPGETIAAAAVRELAEECSLVVPHKNLKRVAELAFFFPYKPEWDQVVHTFLVESWQGEPVESEEMAPAWFPVSEIPYAAMWDDSLFWLPPVLAGKHITARFTFQADNETVAWAEIQVATLGGSLTRR